MNTAPNENANTQNADKTFSTAFYLNSRYNPLFFGVASVGFAAIYILTRFNILGNSFVQLLYISGALILTAALHIPVVRLAQNGKGISASFLSTISILLLAILLTVFWEGIVPVSVFIIFITLLASVLTGFPRRYYAAFFTTAIAGIAGVLYVDTSLPLVERLQTSTPAAFAGLAFLAATGLLLFVIAFIARGDRYRNLRAHLLTSFVIIVTIPALLATTLSAVGAYASNESQVIRVLETISKLKESQINEVVGLLEADATRIAQDTDISRRINRIIASREESPELQDLQQTAARRILQGFLSAGQTSYSEIMVMDISGNVVLSTNASREGANYGSQEFYRLATTNTFVGFSRTPTFEDGKLVLSTPIYEGDVIRGILVLRTQDSLIKRIVETTPGFPEMETYLLGEDFQPLTQTRSITQTVNTQASRALSPGNLATEGRGSYENYAGDNVLGYYQRTESLNAIFISEVPQEFALSASLNSFLGSGVLALLTLLVAFIAVAALAETIAGPIGALSTIAENFAAGNLSTRASISRKDEIGALGQAYNQMAEQLQDTISELERHVADRTKALEDQTYKLRSAAEVARDAAGAHSVNELLDKAGTLIQERFGLYHTGIFLLDNKQEYAILAASPTEAGRQMIANGHKLRVGEVGIVGRVASTGEPRITLETGLDAVHFNNPLLPKTRSEMALPLEVENKIIGVLDVQSDQTQAFNETDLTIMQILAEQLAIAIERTQLLEQLESSLTELRQTYIRSTGDDWKSLAESGLLSNSGYRFDNIRIQPIKDISELGEAGANFDKAVTGANDVIQVKNDVATIPIKLRGYPIGVVTVKLREGYSSATINTIKQAVERLAGSLESARLFEEARLRADREQAIAQVTSSISSVNELDLILRTTVEQIGKSLGQAEVSIQVIDDTEEQTG